MIWYISLAIKPFSQSQGFFQRGTLPWSVEKFHLREVPNILNQCTKDDFYVNRNFLLTLRFSKLYHDTSLLLAKLNKKSGERIIFTKFDIVLVLLAAFIPSKIEIAQISYSNNKEYNSNLFAWHEMFLCGNYFSQIPISQNKFS